MPFPRQFDAPPKRYGRELEDRLLRRPEPEQLQYSRAASEYGEDAIHKVIVQTIMEHPGISGSEARRQVLAAIAEPGPVGPSGKYFGPVQYSRTRTQEPPLERVVLYCDVDQPLAYVKTGYR